MERIGDTGSMSRKGGGFVGGGEETYPHIVNSVIENLNL